jgi:hypothetical protein
LRLRGVERGGRAVRQAGAVGICPLESLIEIIAKAVRNRADGARRSPQ